MRENDAARFRVGDLQWLHTRSGGAPCLADLAGFMPDIEGKFQGRAKTMGKDGKEGRNMAISCGALCRSLQGCRLRHCAVLPALPPQLPGPALSAIGEAL